MLLKFKNKVKPLSINEMSFEEKQKYYTDLAKNWEIEEPSYFSNKYGIPISVIQGTAQWLRRRGVPLSNKTHPSNPSILRNAHFLNHLKGLHKKSKGK
jgi:hypothetical protein